MRPDGQIEEIKLLLTQTPEHGQLSFLQEPMRL